MDRRRRPLRLGAGARGAGEVGALSTRSGFEAAKTRRLRRAGLEGTVRVEARDGALELTGGKTGVLRIPAESVVRLRVGFYEGRHQVYRTILWRGDERRPIDLYPLPQDRLRYARTIREFASAVAARGGVVERGGSIFDALLPPVLMAVPALGAIAVAALSVTEYVWWQRLAVPALPVALFALLAWRAATRHLPRRVRDLAELDRQLPN